MRAVRCRRTGSDRGGYHPKDGRRGNTRRREPEGRIHAPQHDGCCDGVSEANEGKYNHRVPSEVEGLVWMKVKMFWATFEKHSLFSTLLEQ
jgi:hypothetical protein